MTIRIEFRIVVLPQDGLSKEQTLFVAHRAIAAAGPVFDVSVSECQKPPGSFTMRLEANSARRASEIVEELIADVGGVGWITSGDGDEIEAIWQQQNGSVPPLDRSVTWAYIQSIPIAALPPGRRGKGVGSIH